MQASKEPEGPPLTAKHDGPEEPQAPVHCWSRRFDEQPPSRNVHKPSKPGVVEIIGLLPVAVGNLHFFTFRTHYITYQLQILTYSSEKRHIRVK
jgi:hypothetical protein